MLYKLESLRGVAATMVVLKHSPFIFGDSHTLFVAHSYLFVDFFFILSGMVMSLAYADRIGGGMTFRSYVVLRLGRIYPLHLFTLLIWLAYISFKQYLFLSGFGGSEQFGYRENATTFLSNFFLLHSFGLHVGLNWNYPSWSISSEFFAYLCFYVFLISIDRKRSLVVPVVVAVICYAFLVSLGRGNLDISYDYGAIRCLGAFYLGVLIHRLRSRHTIELPYVNISEILLAAGIFLAVMYAEVSIWMSLLVIFLFACTVAGFAGERTGLLGRLLLTPLFRIVGKWSYSVYMVHALVISIASLVSEYIVGIKAEAVHGPVTVLVNLGILTVTVLLSGLTYTFVEQPFRERSKRLAARLRKPADPLA